MRLVALDSETAGLEAKFDPTVPVHCISITERIDGELESICLPWGDEAISLLQEYIDDEEVIFIIHNSPFDVPVFRIRGLNIPPGKYLDSMLLAYLLQPMTGIQNYSLKVLGEFIGVPKFDYRQALIEAGILDSSEKKGAEFLLPFNPIMETYAKQDTETTLQLWEYLSEHLERDERVWYAFYNIEMPYVEVIIEMESGVFIDVPLLEKLREPTQLKLEELRRKILELVPYAPNVSWDEEKKEYVPKYKTYSKKVLDNGVEYSYDRKLTPIGQVVSIKKRVTDPLQYSPHYVYTYEHCPLVEFNPGSSQLPWLMMQLGWEPEEYTKSGQPAVGAEFLKEFDHPLSQLVVDYLNTEKLLGTYIEGLLNAQHNGYVHGSFLQTSTVTTRLASASPNLQNIDPRVKNAFCSPPGYILANADLNSIELCVLAFFLETLFEDSDMANTIRNGDSPHDSNAKRWELPRKDAKTTVFGVVYGQTEKGLSKKLRCSVARAKEILNQVFTKMPAIVYLKEYVTKQATRKRKLNWYDYNTGDIAKQGWLYLLMGHRVYYPSIVAYNKWERQRTERQLGNVIIQGSAGGIFKYLHLQVWRYVKSLGGRAAMAVHDECIFYIPEDKATETVRKDMTALMCSNDLLNDGKNYVPVTAEFFFGYDWTESKDGNKCNLTNKDRWDGYNRRHEAVQVMQHEETSNTAVLLQSKQRKKRTKKYV